MLTPERAKLAIATSRALRSSSEGRKEALYELLTNRDAFHLLLSKVGLYPVLLNMFSDDEDVKIELDREAAKYWHK